MKKENIYLSTIAPEAASLARKHGFGLEIAEYCTAWNMDRQVSSTDHAVWKNAAYLTERHSCPSVVSSRFLGCLLIVSTKLLKKK